MLTQNPCIEGRNGNQAESDTEARIKRVALLLAGGDGMRLRELTCQIAGSPIPKQYCRLFHGTSMLEATISRARVLFPPDRINIILNRNHLDLARDQIVNLPESNIFVQPLNRDTGPGMIFALLHLQRAFGDAIVAAFPTDHYIDKEWTFIAHVMRAIIAVSSIPDKIAILGVVPDRPETGYGYILPAGALNTPGKAYSVETFVEKPNRVTAQEIILRGGLWNTFVMVFRLGRMLELVQETVPTAFEKLCAIREKPGCATDLYQTIEPWNFSTQMLARIPQHLMVLQVSNVAWSDWGTRESIERTCKALSLEPHWRMAKAGGGREKVDARVSDIIEMQVPKRYSPPASR